MLDWVTLRRRLYSSILMASLFMIPLNFPLVDSAIIIGKNARSQQKNCATLIFFAQCFMRCVTYCNKSSLLIYVAFWNATLDATPGVALET